MGGWKFLVVMASLAFATSVCDARLVIRERFIVRRPCVVLERPPVMVRPFLGWKPVLSVPVYGPPQPVDTLRPSPAPAR